MKKVLLFALCVAIMISAAACSGGSSGGGGGNDKGPKEDAVKIDDIDYTVESAVLDGERRVVFSYTNNSKYPILSVSIENVLKKDIADDDIKDKFKVYIDEGATVDDVKGSVLTTEYLNKVAAGETSGKDECLIGYSYVMDTDVYECYEPNIATIKYVGDDNKIYTEYYDFSEKKYSLDEEVIDADKWGTGEIASALEKPEGVFVTEIEEEDNKFTFNAEGVLAEDFNAYKQKLKDAGFSKNADDGDSSYEAESEDGKQSVDASYDDYDGTMRVTVENK